MNVRAPKCMSYLCRSVFQYGFCGVFTGLTSSIIHMHYTFTMLSYRTKFLFQIDKAFYGLNIEFIDKSYMLPVAVYLNDSLLEGTHKEYDIIRRVHYTGVTA